MGRIKQIEDQIKLTFTAFSSKNKETIKWPQTFPQIIKLVPLKYERIAKRKSKWPAVVNRKTKPNGRCGTCVAIIPHSMVISGHHQTIHKSVARCVVVRGEQRPTM